MAANQLETAPPPEWVIGVACDIRLREIFQNNPVQLKDAYIDVDPAAIQTTLHALDPASVGGGVLVTAAHEEHPKLKNYGLAGLATHYKKRNLTSILVASGGTSAVIQRAYESLTPDLVSETKLEKTSGSAGRNSASPMLTLKFTHYGGTLPVVPTKPEDLQSTSVHELQHAADFINRKITRQQNRHFYHFLGKSAAQLLLPPAIAASSSAVAGELLTGSVWNTYPLSLVGLIYGFKFGGKLAARTFHKYMTSGILEQRANEAEELASSLPPIISYKSA